MKICVNTTVWMHHLDANKIHRQKARWELYKNSMCCLAQIQGATIHKTTTLWLLTSHLKNHASKMNTTCGARLDKQGITHKWYFSMIPTHGHSSVGWLARNTCWEQWMVGIDGEKESGKSILSVWLDDYDNVYKYLKLIM